MPTEAQDTSVNLPMVAEWGSATTTNFEKVVEICAGMTNNGWLIRFVVPEASRLQPGQFVYRVLGERYRPLNEAERQAREQQLQQAN